MVKPENVLETIVFPMTYGFFYRKPQYLMVKLMVWDEHHSEPSLRHRIAAS